MPLLMKQGSGDFAKLDKTLEDTILEYIPKNQSAFDHVLPALRRAYKNNQSILEIRDVMETINNHRPDMLSGEKAGRATKDTEHIVELVLRNGINEDNILQQKWAAAQGPMPVLIQWHDQGTPDVPADEHYLPALG